MLDGPLRCCYYFGHEVNQSLLHKSLDQAVQRSLLETISLPDNHNQFVRSRIPLEAIEIVIPATSKSGSSIPRLHSWARNGHVNVRTVVQLMSMVERAPFVS